MVETKPWKNSPADFIGQCLLQMFEMIQFCQEYQTTNDGKFCKEIARLHPIKVHSQ